MIIYQHRKSRFCFNAFVDFFRFLSGNVGSVMLGLLVYGLVDLVHNFSGHMRTNAPFRRPKIKVPMYFLLCIVKILMSKPIHLNTILFYIVPPRQKK